MANQSVYGIVNNRSELERIVQELKKANVSTHDISFLTQQSTDFSELENTTTTGRNWRTEERLTDYPAGTKPEERFRTTNTAGANSTFTNKTHGSTSGLGHEKNTKAPEGATTGATTGGIIGGVLGLLAGIGALAIPGVGPFVAAGPLLATLSGIGAGGTIGGIIGALVGAGIPEYEAKRYEKSLKQGSILLSVRCADKDVSKVKEILERCGAHDVSSSSEVTTSKNKKQKLKETAWT